MDWGQIYLPKESKIESIVDLDGKRIATIEGGILLNSLKNLLTKFGVTCEFVIAKTYVRLTTTASH